MVVELNLGGEPGFSILTTGKKPFHLPWSLLPTWGVLVSVVLLGEQDRDRKGCGTLRNRLCVQRLSMAYEAAFEENEADNNKARGSWGRGHSNGKERIKVLRLTLPYM